MNTDVALNIAKRFITLPVDKRRLYLEKMYAENISPANLPVPSVQSFFDCIPLSYAQRRQWFLWQLNPQSPAYNIPTALKLTGALDREALQSSFQQLIARHETLRTTFREHDEHPVQIIHPVQPFFLDVEYLAASESLESWVGKEIQQPFDLELGPLLRVKLLRLSDSEHVLLMTLHHVISDGWSMPIIIDELIQLYESFSSGMAFELPALPIQYADYAIWQRNWMEAGEQERQLAYWTAKLGGEQPVLELPCDRARASVPDQRGALLEIELDLELGRALKTVAQRQGCTLFMVLLASFQCLLHRYSGQHDIRVGVPIANRTRVETESLIGFFVNTQVLKAEFELTTTFEQLLQQIRQAVLEAQTYQELPFEQLVEALQPDRSLSHSPLFQVMFNHQTQSKRTARVVHGLQVEAVSREGISAQFDLTLNTFEHETGIGAALNYATALFDHSTMQRLIHHWRHLLQQVVRQPGMRITDIPLLDSTEFRQIIRDWNSTSACYRGKQCIHELVEQQVEKSPEATALLFGNQSLTFVELNQRANRLAHKLRELGVGPDVLVGIAVERSVEMVVGLLGILKAGGAYVPLDPEYPQERLAYMLEHSGAQLLLTQERLLGQLPATGITTWCLDRDWQQLAGYSSDNLGVALHPDHTAYCIYTSGSTGKPKGVAVRHQALVNFLFSMAQQPGLTADDRVLALTSLSFDIAGLELYLPLLMGASVVLLADRENQDPHALLRLIEQQSVTTVQATPSTWRMLLDAAGPEALRNCRLLSGGEALAPDLANRLLERSGQVWNLYGPTETTIWSGLHCLDRKSPTPLLGKPIANTTLHIVEQGMSAAPIGVAGELLIGGDGLARGYLHRPDLTAERFVPNPFDTSEQGGGRLYRTGDLARYHADGVIEYISRIDHQVKIRGFRIELGEIEAKLLEHEAVREAVVIDVEGPNGRQLAAYVVPVDQTAMSKENSFEFGKFLREYLSSVLAGYMVPAYVVLLGKLPLTPNGKLDRKSLAEPEVSFAKRKVLLPRTRLERQLSAIWCEVLGRPDVGLNDEFFELGGSSLLLLSALKKIQDQIDSRITIHDFMQNLSIYKQAEFLRGGLASKGGSMVRLNSYEGAQTAIFCLPPAGGTSFPYSSLAKVLSEVCPVYALLHKGFVEKGFSYKSWDEMVKHYYAEIVMSQATGPYKLLGWSSGGALAIEVAHLLENAGEDVEFLALVDPMLPQHIVEHHHAKDDGASSEAVDLADVNERNQAAVMMVRSFFSEKSDEDIMVLVREGRAFGFQDDKLVEFLIESLASERGGDVDAFKAIYDAYAMEAEFAVGYDTYGNVADLIRDFQFRAVKAKPDVWWSSMFYKDINLLENKLVNECVVSGLSSAKVINVSHERIVYVSEFIHDLRQHLEKTSDRLGCDVVRVLPVLNPDV